MSSPLMSVEKLHGSLDRMKQWPLSRGPSPTSTVNYLDNTPLHPYEGHSTNQGDSSTGRDTHQGFAGTGQGDGSSANHFHRGRDFDEGELVTSESQSDKGTVIHQFDNPDDFDGGVLVITDDQDPQPHREISEVPTNPGYGLRYPLPHEERQLTTAGNYSSHNNGRQGLTSMASSGLPIKNEPEHRNYPDYDWNTRRGAVPGIKRSELPGFKYVQPFPINAGPDLSAVPHRSSMADPSTQADYKSRWPEKNDKHIHWGNPISVGPNSYNVDPCAITDAKAYSGNDSSTAQLEALTKDTANLPYDDEFPELNSFLESLQGVPDEDLLVTGMRKVNEAQTANNIPASNFVGASAVKRNGTFYVRPQSPTYLVKFKTGEETTGSTGSSETVNIVLTPQATTGGPQQPTADYINFARDPQSAAETHQTQGNRLQSQLDMFSRSNAQLAEDVAFWEGACRHERKLRDSENRAASDRITELETQINSYAQLFDRSAQDSEANVRSLRDLTEKYGRLKAYSNRLSGDNTTLKSRVTDLERENRTLEALLMTSEANVNCQSSEIDKWKEQFQRLSTDNAQIKQDLGNANEELFQLREPQRYN